MGFNFPIIDILSLIELALIQRQILNGLLLGDGCLFLGIANINPLLTVARAAKDFEYLEYHYSIFKNLSSDEGIIKSDKTDNKSGKIYKGFKFRTRALSVLSPYYKLWYPKGYKIVPSNLSLEPLVLATWFCDDGSVVPKINRNGTKGPALRLKISTNSFSKNDVIFLAESLSSKFNEKFSIYHDNLDWYKKKHPEYIVNQNINWFIQTYTSGAHKFFEEIKPIFPKGMERKYNIFKEYYDGRLESTSCTY